MTTQGNQQANFPKQPVAIGHGTCRIGSAISPEALRQTNKMFLATKNQSGVTLVEVLVSLVVLSIGLLGLASLQAKSLRFGQQSYERSQAALLASELGDLMRASRAMAVAGAYVMSTAPTSSNANCSSATCTPSELVAYDLYTWASRVSSLLPKGRAVVSCASPCSNGSVQQVAISWDENHTGSTSGTYTLSFAP